MFLAVAAGLLVTSGLAGYGVFMVSRRSRRRWLSAVFAVASAFVLVIASGLAYVAIGSTPASNERIGFDRRVVIEMRLPSADEQSFQPNPGPVSVPSTSTEPPSDLGPVPTPVPPPPVLSLGRETVPQLRGQMIGEIALLFPASVTSHEDFSLGVTVLSQHQIPTAVRTVRLSAPRSAEVRTLDTCGPDEKSALSACSTSDGKKFQVAWDVTPTEPGELLFTIGLPADVMPHYGAHEWRAQFIERRSRDRIGPSTSAPAFGASVISPALPAMTWDGVSVDLESQQIRIPVFVETTLGVSRNVYTALALIGTALSGLLGSGWLWRFLEWWRGSRGQSHLKGAAS